MFTCRRYAPTVSLLVLVLGFPAAAQQQALPQQQYNQPAAQQVVPQQATPQQSVPQQGFPQQGALQPAPAQAPVAPQPPQGFALNALQQAALNQVLDAWETESEKINTFKCPFQRWEYNMAFGPANRNIPLNKNLGELSYSKPDKGSFQITEITTFQAPPVPPGQQPPAQQQGTWVKQPDAIGEHWVCDGKSIFEYRHNQKQLVERPLPPEFQGKAIADGPLPFLFGAKAASLKERYWMVIDDQQQPNPNQVWLRARPKFIAADFSEVMVILDRQQLLPQAMQVQMPNGDRHVYIFDLANATKNSKFALLQSLFERPRVPSGWKRVVENAPVQQAAQPEPPPR